MEPSAGEHVLRYVGDRLAFRLQWANGAALSEDWRGFLRTTLGRAGILRHEIIHAHLAGRKLANAPWRDLPMAREGGHWQRDLTLTEPGYFRAKAFAVDPQGRQHWPAGPDLGVSVHPDSCRSANLIYCAFARMFGPTRTARTTQDPRLDEVLGGLDRTGYAVIPPSGKLRDLIAQLPHIMDTLGCRILHLLPVNPTPTVYARFGRFGSPYAALHLTGIDPALVEFDRHTTGVDQFRELTYAVHARAGRVFLDIVANHTGWGSLEQETHPEWYLRNERGDFVCPGAWGVTWEDLVECDQRNPALWEYLAEVFLTWCRRGVDGFRCDAGYKIPERAWRYITARVLDEFPETIFLLEGLGGSWEATERLLTEGGMQWTYSELFQNYTGSQVAWYLDHCLRQSRRLGLYVHYSETHDNERLAAKGRAWSLLRNRLCALASVSGGFGFTCGVEWLAPERVNVHASRGLAWDNPDNIVPELARLNALLADHPAFRDGAQLTRLSPPDSHVLALSRVSADGLAKVLVLINTDPEQPHSFALTRERYQELNQPALDLLAGRTVDVDRKNPAGIGFMLDPGACYCLADEAQPRGLSGREYRLARAQAAWAIQSLSRVLSSENIGPFDWPELARRVAAGPARLLSAFSALEVERARADLLAAIDQAAKREPFPNVVRWTLIDLRRVTPVPPGHWLLVEDVAPFRASLVRDGRATHLSSIEAGDRHLACFAPPAEPRPSGSVPFRSPAKAGEAELLLERYAAALPRAQASIRFLAARPEDPQTLLQWPQTEVALLTNGRGGMARLQVDLGDVKSKYDCVLGANFHPDLPVDRHVFVKRVRVWVVADGFISPLNHESLAWFVPGPPARWRFVAGAGDTRSVEVHLTADMLPGQNTTVLRFTRPPLPPAYGADLPPEANVSLTVRVDIEDRNFHTETHRNPGAEHHFTAHTRPLDDRPGFAFAPAPDRHLRVFSDAGQYHPEPEWHQDLAHPVETSRGLADRADVYSPGWFELPLAKNATATILLTAEPEASEDFVPSVPFVSSVPSVPSKDFEQTRARLNEQALQRAGLSPDDGFGRQLALAAQAFLARRGQGKTIIAGYPWFLDWGRDSLICARGLLAAGLVEEVREMLLTYGRFVEHGTLANQILGENASDRDTSDAPLWFGVACEELEKLLDSRVYELVVGPRQRTLADVLAEIGAGYRAGTPNGIRTDPATALVFSPSHFTWMDTNHPAGTPREGYPVEIQVLWIRLLRLLARLELKADGESWSALAARAEASFHRLFWLEERGYYSDLLIAGPRQSAETAVVDNALRSNFLLAISLGLVRDERARRGVEAALRYLVVPGALRTLAPLPVSPPLAIHSPHGGHLLNHPTEPYWGRYEGDEDTRRKPAYHNGTAWLWTFPTFCEALALAWDFAPPAVAAAKAYLGSLDRLLAAGCAGHLPEVLDGDAPHAPRGCDAQAWSVTEALRVWKVLTSRTAESSER
jgi:predicted glycogen debranching enzyme